MIVSRQAVETVLMRPLDEREEEYVDSLLEAAEAIAFARVPTLHERVALSESAAKVFNYVVGSMVARVLRNPDSIYRTESDGDYSYTVDSSAVAARLYLSADELRMLSAGAYGWGASRPGKADRERYPQGWPKVVLPLETVDALRCESKLSEAGVEVISEID